MPGMPSTPTAVEIGAIFGSILARPLPSDSACGLPAGARQHDVALGKTGIVRGDHLADRAAFHHAADRHRLAHRTGRRSCARACRDRATARWCAAAPRPRPGVGTVYSSRRKSRWLGLAHGARGENDAFCLGHGGFLGYFVFRHCERSDLSAIAQRAKAEAIHSRQDKEMDCFVAALLAMTAWSAASAAGSYAPPG